MDSDQARIGWTATGRPPAPSHRPGSVARRLVASVLLAAAAVPVTSPLRLLEAQVTASVPLESRAYARIEALAAEGLFETLIQGQRPWSRREIARLTAEARTRLPEVARRSSAERARRLERTIAALEAEFGAGGSSSAPVPRPSRRMDGALLEAVAHDSPTRPIADVGLGAIDAGIAPLLQGRGGREYGGSGSLAAEAAASGEAGRHVALRGHVRAATHHGAGEMRGALDVRAASATIGARNIVMEVGRQQVLHGQGMDGGLLASRNAPGLDMIRIGNDVPARLPWILARLGPARGTLFVADLGAGQHFPHTKLAGWKVSFLPSPRFEVGASLISQQGGEGAPPARWYERAIDVATIVDVLFIQDRDLQISNKLAGIDARWRWQGGLAYAELLVDDFDHRRLASSLWQDAGIIGGFVLPQLGDAGTVTLEGEYQHTGLRYYQHAEFRSGVTARGSIIGLPLGPRGDGVVVRASWDPERAVRVSVTGAVERRSGDLYTVSIGGPDDSGWAFVKTLDRPEELRGRMILGLSRAAGAAGVRVDIEGGVERVRNDAFSAGASRTNAVGRVALVFGFQ